MKALAPLALGFASLLFTESLRAENPVIVHEWGTFTSLQDENGKAIGGINVDDEPVPSFVWNLAGPRVIPLHGSEPNTETGLFGLPPYTCPGDKGWAEGDPNVTMRLETPVLYIYPPKGVAPSSVPPLDVHVDFHGGVLSQYYPCATVTGAPLNGGFPYFTGTLTSSTTLGLTWKGVQLGASGDKLTKNETGVNDPPPYWLGQVVETDNKVWTTPRETGAPLLQVKGALQWGEHGSTITQTEHFLFYRGVGHLDSPVFINSHDKAFVVGLRSVGVSATSGWLVQIRADGACAARFIQNEAFGVPTTAMPSVGGMLFWNESSPRSFANSDFATSNLAKLKTSMQDALVNAGLYPDEASAMLRTWELSYFKSPGLRFFYIVPRAWVDQTLPLKITGAPVQITRVMVGRIELISAEQQATLARLKNEAYPDLPGLKRLAQAALNNGKYSREQQDDFYTGARPLADLGITLSASVRDYLSLGRFRDALIVHEQQEHPSENLARFIKENDLAAR